MTLDKSIQSGKERRKPYRGAKSIDSTCRNHGSCEWCRRNRAHKNKKRELAAEWELRDYDGKTDKPIYCTCKTKSQDDPYKL